MTSQSYYDLTITHNASILGNTACENIVATGSITCDDVISQTGEFAGDVTTNNLLCTGLTANSGIVANNDSIINGALTISKKLKAPYYQATGNDASGSTTSAISSGFGSYWEYNRGLIDGTTSFMNHIGSYATGGFKFMNFDSLGAYLNTPFQIASNGQSTFNGLLNLNAGANLPTGQLLTLVGNVSANSTTITPIEMSYLDGGTQNINAAITPMQTKTTDMTYNAGTSTTTFGNNITVTGNTNINGNIVANSATITPIELSYLDGGTQNINGAITPLQTKTTDITYNAGTTSIANTFTTQGVLNINAGANLPSGQLLTVSGSIYANSKTISPLELSYLDGLTDNINTTLSSILLRITGLTYSGSVSTLTNLTVTNSLNSLYEYVRGADSTLLVSPLANNLPGSYSMYNRSNGGGESIFANQPGGGSGGFKFLNFNTNGTCKNTPFSIAANGDCEVFRNNNVSGKLNVIGLSELNGGMTTTSATFTNLITAAAATFSGILTASVGLVVTQGEAFFNNGSISIKAKDGITPYIDFTTMDPDYDVRIQQYGGSVDGVAKGSLTIYADGGVTTTGTLNCPVLNVTGGLSAPTLTISGYSTLGKSRYSGQPGAMLFNNNDGLPNTYPFSIYTSIPDYSSFNNYGSYINEIIPIGTLCPSLDITSIDDMYVIYPGFTLKVFNTVGYVGVTILFYKNNLNVPVYVKPTVLNAGRSCYLLFNDVII